MENQLSYPLMDVASVKIAEAEKVNPALVDALAASIKENGLLHPITVDKDSFVQIGKARYLAAVKAGLQRIPVRVSDADETDLKLTGKQENFTRRSYTVLEKALEFVCAPEQK